jgi:CubicO group peptidase (beta-lactamase class C family)
MPYERYVEERLFAPVGLVRTSWDAIRPYAQGYLVEPYEDVIRPEPLPDLRVFRSAGQLWSTVGDLAQWGSFLGGPDPDVLRPESAAEMRAFQGMSDLQRWSAGYGLGLQLFRDGDRVFYGHSGGMPGYITFLACSASERTGAVVLTAASGGRVAGQLCLQMAGRAADALAVSPEPWRPAEPAPDELTSVLGSWWFEDTEFLLRYVGGKLQVSFPAIPQVAPGVFERESEDVYRSVSGYERGELLRIVRDDSGQPVKLYLATYPVTRHPQVFGV